MISTVSFPGISDKWLNACYYTKSSFVTAASLASDRIFHYDVLLTITYFLLVLIPYLFRIYGFGSQQTLKSFYDSSRLIIIQFSCLIGFSLSFSSIIQLIAPQPTPCATWDGLNVLPAPYSSRTPNEDLIIIFITGAAIWSAELKTNLARRVIVVIVSTFECILHILAGHSSLSQVIISLSLATWLYTVTTVSPPIAIPIFSFLSLLGSIVVFITYFSLYKFSNEMVTKSLLLCIRGMTVLVVSTFLYIRFILKRNISLDKFNIKAKCIQESESTTGDAIIPKMARDDDQNEFIDFLSRDLIDGIISFLFYLLGNMILLIIYPRFQLYFD